MTVNVIAKRMIAGPLGSILRGEVVEMSQTMAEPLLAAQAVELAAPGVVARRKVDLPIEERERLLGEREAALVKRAADLEKREADLAAREPQQNFRRGR